MKFQSIVEAVFHYAEATPDALCLADAQQSYTYVQMKNTVIAVAGGSRRELLGKRVTAELEQLMENRRIYRFEAGGAPLSVTDGVEGLTVHVAAPILAEGDLLGLVLFVDTQTPTPAADAEYKLAQTISAFLGRHMEG